MQDGDESVILSGRPAFAGSFQGGSRSTDDDTGITSVESPLPSQLVIYLGVELNSVSMRAQLSQQRMEALTAQLRHVISHNVVSALSVMQLLGMSVGHVVIPLGLLHMRWLQRWYTASALTPCVSRDATAVGQIWTYWSNPHVLSVGVPLGRSASHISVFIDASLSG